MEGEGEEREEGQKRGAGPSYRASLTREKPFAYTPLQAWNTVIREEGKWRGEKYERRVSYASMDMLVPPWPSNIPKNDAFSMERLVWAMWASYLSSGNTKIKSGS
jgi:hypothetical protein